MADINTNAEVKRLTMLAHFYDKKDTNTLLIAKEAELIFSFYVERQLMIQVAI